MGADSYEDGGDYKKTANDYEKEAERRGELSTEGYDGKPTGFAQHNSFDRPVVGPKAELVLCDTIHKETTKWGPVEVGRFIQGNVSYKDPEVQKHAICLRKYETACLDLWGARSRLKHTLRVCREARLKELKTKKKFNCKNCKCSGPPGMLLREGKCRICKTDATPPPKKKSQEVKAKTQDLKTAERNKDKAWKSVEKSLRQVSKAHKRNSKKMAKAGKVKRKKKDKNEEWLPYPAAKAKAKAKTIKELRFGTVAAGWVAY